MDSQVVNVFPGRLSLARAWLWLGIMALIGSGLLALLLVFSRTPGIQDVFPLKEFFRSALVVHVDLSVAIWFMAFATVIWSAVGGAGLAWLGWAGFGLVALGTAVMTVSPFFPGAEPVLNNYIPVLKTGHVFCLAVDLWRRFFAGSAACPDYHLATACLRRAAALRQLCRCHCGVFRRFSLLLVLGNGAEDRRADLF